MEICRFWSKVRTSDIHSYNDTPCLEWLAAKNQQGYGEFWLNGKLERSHRVSYENKFGKISEGLEIDHLCRNRCCINTDHLQVVPHKENMRRAISANRNKTRCPQGHEYTSENIYIQPNGGRNCRICREIRSHVFYQHQKLKKGLA